MQSKIKKTLYFLIGFTVAVIILFLFYVNSYYHADLEGYQLREENFIDQDTYLAKSKNQARQALIFYPGAKVEFTAYIPLVDHIAQKTNLDIYLLKMPYNLAILDPDRALDVIKLKQYDKWYIGGHSLGGAFASSFASKNIDLIDGLILLGSYPYGEFPIQDTLSIFGSLESEDVKEKNTALIYKHEIQGGNHAQFGNYGDQKGDAKAWIDRDSQQKEAIEVLSKWLNR